VSDAGGPEGAAVDVQGIFSVLLDDLRTAYRAPMADAFGPVVGQR
jgi:hypothetical protein